MGDDPKPLAEGDGSPELRDLLAFYVERLNRGETCHPQEILARHAEVGEQLLDCLEDYVATEELGSSAVRTLGDYVLREEIGRGGMGVVYHAWQNSLDREVALKILPVGVAADDKAFHRFMREAKTAARLNHENIVRVYGMGVESNTPYYAMESVDGQTLAQLLAGEGEKTGVIAAAFGGSDRKIVDHDQIAEAFAGVADGLQHAHSRGIVHRDIKPSNLILDGQRRLRILDFGLARSEGCESLTLSGDVVGTPVYMSPEQARRRTKIDHRTDIYSLGTTLYEVLAHRPPFKGADHSDTLSRILHKDPVPVRRFDTGIPRSLETIVLKCLRKNPRDRYQTAEALREDLRRFARGEPIEARPLPQWQRGLRWAQRNTLRLGAAAMILTLLSFLTYSALQPQEMVNQRVLSTAVDGLAFTSFWDMRPSPDGLRVAYSRMGSDGALIVRDLTSGESRQVTTGEYTSSGLDGPVWSPDGRRIAYTMRTREGAAQLKIVDLETLESTVPAGTEDLKLTPLDWSPDGEAILCVSDSGSLVSVSPRGGEVATLVEEGLIGESTGVFSRDGEHIAFTALGDDDLDVFLIRRDGGDRQRVSDTLGAELAPLWSPAGDRLLFHGEDGVWTVRVVGGQIQEEPDLVRSRPFGHPLVWTEDGLFYRSMDTQVTLYGLPVDSRTGESRSDPTSLLPPNVPGPHRGVWSPDMERIAFATYDGGELYVYTTTNSSLQTIETGSRLRPVDLWWSGDGERLLYVPKREHPTTVYSVDLASGDMSPLFPPVKDAERFQLSPDGETMVFYRWNGIRSNGRRELIVSRVGKREGTVLAAETEEDVGQFSNWVRPVFSPDGQQVLFATRASDLWIAAVDGSSKRIVHTEEEERRGSRTNRIRYAVWHPGGRHVAYDDWQSVVVVNIATGEAHRTPLSEDVGDLQGVWQWSPDGTRISLTASKGGGFELWRVRNFLPDSSP